MHRIRIACLLVALALPTGAPRLAGQEAPAATEERQLRAAIRLNPEAPALHAGLGEALRRQGRLVEAMESHRRAVSLAPDSAEYRARLAAVLLEAGEWERAELQFRQAIRLDSARADLHAGLGESLRRQSLLLPAREAFARAARLDPGNPEYGRLLRGTELEGEIAGGETGERWAGWILRGLVALFAAALTLAGLALLVPIAAALFLLLIVAPVAALRQGRR